MNVFWVCLPYVKRKVQPSHKIKKWVLLGPTAGERIVPYV